MGVPQNGWFLMDNPSKMDDLRIALFQETSTCPKLEMTTPFFAIVDWESDARPARPKDCGPPGFLTNLVIKFYESGFWGVAQRLNWRSLKTIPQKDCFCHFLDARWFPYDYNLRYSITKNIHLRHLKCLIN